MKLQRIVKMGLFSCLLLMMMSCEKFIEIAEPKSSIVPSAVFQSNDLAISAMLGVYQQMAASGYASGDVNSISVFCGAAADELTVYNATLSPFFQSQLLPENLTLRSMWSTIYARIYNLNTLLEGLQEANTLSPAVAKQLEGEALFTRAFNYFYLVNLFGDVPLYLSTDYQSNSKAFRSKTAVVYQQIIADLKTAETKLDEAYVSVERIRPNKATAQALLAKVYSYLEDWPNAENYAKMVIDRTDRYELLPFDEIFLKNSKEAIWQLMPTANGNTPAGNLFILTTTPNTVSLSSNLVINGFEAGDLRKQNWVRSLTVQGSTYYYPYKYKVRSSTTVTEYIMVLRLAEMYLIRAEARAERDELTLAIEDVDRLRGRAGLALLKNTQPNITKEDLLKLIAKERLAELFSEWGNRWFDLKRTGQASAVLAPIKPEWKSTAVLFPIPKLEIDNNKNITQNEGY